MGLATAGPAAADPPQASTGDEGKVADSWITTKVKAKILADDLLDGSDVNVDTTGEGVVTLTGRVPSEAAHERAVSIARATDGVTRVVDRLQVGAVPPKPSKTEAVTDPWITSKVKTKIVADRSLRESKIDVDTAAGVVTLKGRVPDQAARERALEIARSTHGVVKVVDQLQIAVVPVERE